VAVDLFIAMESLLKERADRIYRRLEELATITDEPGMICRTFLSAAMRRANLLVGGWMLEAGLEVSQDSVENLIGEEPQVRADPDSPIFIMGSHLDTVRNAGRFDGSLGVLLAIEAIDFLRSSGAALPFGITAVGFSDEEGTRFHSSYIGSMAFCGIWKREDLALVDEKGISLLQALEELSPGNRFTPSAAHYSPDRVRGYLEVHIEQGPVLESEGLSLAVVSAIAGQSRFKLHWSGKASHAGTTPRHLRRDALVGAAQFIREVRAAFDRFPEVMATVGQLTVEPNVSNVVPDRVVHSLDVRHQDDSMRQKACLWLDERAQTIAAEHGLKVRWENIQSMQAIPCDSALSMKLLQSVERTTGVRRLLPSGAGHDAAVLSRHYPVAMLFVRCRAGLSHHPAEYASPEDVGVALQATIDFLMRESGTIASPGA
jgi:allantoate deiminase